MHVLKRVVAKNLVVVITLFFVSLTVNAQVKNSQLDLDNAYAPSVAVSKTNTQNIVVAASPGKVYYTTSGGLSWARATLHTTPGTGNLSVMSDFKGNFYCLSLTPNKNKLLIQESKDGGKTWSTPTGINTDTAKYIVQPTLTVDRKGNFFAAWTALDQLQSTADNCTSRVLLSRSSNARKWGKPLELSQAKGNCADNLPTGVTIAVMGDGQRAFAAWTYNGQILFDRSFDGNTWLSNDIAIAQQFGGWKTPVTGMPAANGLPRMVIDNTKKTQLTGALYAAWADKLPGREDSDIRFMRSTNFGDNWTQPVEINGGQPNAQQVNPYLTLDSESGFIYVVYYDRRAYTDEQTDVYLAYSVDAGNSFKNVKISEKPFRPTDVVTMGEYISVSAHAGVIVPVWSHVENGKNNILVSVIKHDDLVSTK